MTTTSKLLIYQTEGSNTRLGIWLQNETVWLKPQWISRLESNT